MPQTPTPIPTMSQKDFAKRAPRRAAPAHMAAAKKLEKTCSRFPSKEPAVDPPSVSDATMCRPAIKAASMSSFLGMRERPAATNKTGKRLQFQCTERQRERCGGD